MSDAFRNSPPLISLGAIETADLRTSLDALLAWLDKQNAYRQRKIIEYLVEEELAGRGHLVKAYALAIDVFDKDEDFDPAKSSLVRVEMRRLRLSLERFKLDGADGAAYAFEVPVGAYRIYATLASPSDQNASAINPAPPEEDEPPPLPVPPGPRFSRLSRAVGSVIGLVLVMVGVAWLAQPRSLSGLSLWRSGEQELSSICMSRRPIIGLRPSLTEKAQQAGQWTMESLESLTTEVANSFPLITVVTGENCKGRRFADLELKVDLVSDQAGQPIYNVTSRLHADDKQTTLAFGNENLMQREADKDLGIAIAQTMFALVEQPGIIPRAFANTKNKATPQQNVEDYRCVLQARTFAQTEIEDKYLETLQCMEKLVEKETQYADIPAVYASLLFYQKIGDVAPSTLNVEQRMMEAVAKAREINPVDSRYFRVQLQVLRHSDIVNRATMFDLVTRMDKAYRYEPSIIGESGRVEALYFGRWEHGAEKVQKARNILKRPKDFPYFDLAYAIYKKDKAMASESARIVVDDGIPIYLIQGLACATLAGDKALQQRFRKNLKALGLNSYDELVAIVQQTSFDPSLEAPLLEYTKRGMDATA